ncbi:hypothetical protein BD410DRAFT_816842 [Rickenella mellea]|uniref:Uncharacterized protein n=1 Tax=Rickenella mellea TaxID=50990 RepID=A0A4Y7PLP9_9AGAM|nr:hypothetical protein BD410DRAFT_816842 [Rickenella mellea]
MFLVGIIPGPHEPSLEQINHLLAPLVDDLLRFWHTGVRYTRTHLFRQGRLTRCVVIPVVCDVPAARQMSGFSSHSAMLFCSVCNLRKNQIENLNYRRWTRRTSAEHRKYAEQWRDSETRDAQDDIFDNHGLRWSELLRLPYWDPINFTVIDTMHALFLGNLKRHCRRVFGMDIDIADGDGSQQEVAPKAPLEKRGCFES